MQIRKTVAVVTLSDKGSQGLREDTSGAYLKEIMIEQGFELVSYEVLADRKALIVDSLIRLVEQKNVALILTTGGTGLSPTDVTPEAMAEVLELEIPGIAEAMRAASMLKTDRAMLSRGKAGTRKQTLIINFPGSRKAVVENLEVVLPVLEHALEKIQGGIGDCGGS